MVGSLVISTVWTSIGISILSAQATPQEATIEATSMVVGTRNAANRQQDKKVTLTVRDSTIRYIIHALAAQTNMMLVGDVTDQSLSKRISVQFNNTSLSKALATALNGTELVAGLSSDGETILIRKRGADSITTQTRSGDIVGTVTDSATGKGIVGVIVSIVGTKLGTTTKDEGRYMLGKVPAGEHRINYKLFGYKFITRVVTVVEGKSTTMHVVMAPTATQLSGVVTTATGLQRKVEVGNDITQLSVPEVIKTMPVSNMSELLATRVPGLEVAPTSGAPGAPSRIRIRGVSSINATNDPIIIVDGIRVYAAQTNYSGSSPNGVLQSSPIDQLDVNNIETVEVLKGPSAVALYGSDAANGVIVITSKRGQVGSPRWDAQAIFGVTTDPGKWPLNYWMWGHQPPFESSVMQCTVGTTWCVQDSLARYQLLNDPATTVFARGSTQEYRTNVSGGRSGMTYVLSASSSRELGALKLPDADVAVLRRLGATIPAWQRRPQQNSVQSVQATVGLDIGSNSDVLLTNSVTQNTNLTTPWSSAIEVTKRMPLDAQSVAEIPDSLWGSGALYEIPDFRAKTTTKVLGFRNSVNLNTRWPYAITTQATTGVEVRRGQDITKLERGACMEAGFARACGPTEFNGYYNVGRQNSLIPTVNLRASQQQALNRWLSLRTSVGMNYTSDRFDYVYMYGSDIPAGANSPDLAVSRSGNENRSVQTTAGGYVEMLIGVADRFFIPLALRNDAGNALGPQVTVKLPKLSWSYLMSEEPWFQDIPVLRKLSVFRPRVAYGQAGVQPKVGGGTRTYMFNNGVIDGSTVPYVTISSPGNSKLLPERTRELEGGFDAEVGQWINLGLTWYHKKTYDMLTTEPTAASAGFGERPATYNLGDVLNTGFEGHLEGTLVDKRMVRVDTRLSISGNRNRLLRLGVNTEDRARQTNSGASQNRVGYPLNGVWVYPIVAVEDKNHDGFPDNNEILWSDSAEYKGVGVPKYTFNMGHTMRLGPWVTVATTFSYQSQFTQYMRGYGHRLSAVLNDPTISLRERAILLYGSCVTITTINNDCGGNIIQTVSIWRFNEFSAAVAIPAELTRTVLGPRRLHIALQGRNLRLWTNYRGKDPNVNSSVGDQLLDFGSQPTPRIWQISLRID